MYATDSYISLSFTLHSPWLVCTICPPALCWWGVVSYAESTKVSVYT